MWVQSMMPWVDFSGGGVTISSHAATHRPGISELFVLCGQGARYDRRVSNVFGWNTEQGFVRDPRALDGMV